MTENNYMNEQLLAQISKEQNVSKKQIEEVLKLLGEGATVPFIARYRKEATGGLDEEQIRAISTEYEYGIKLQDRKDDVMRLIEEKGKLTPEIKKAILDSNKLSEIEDIYRPYKEKKKTRATTAKNKGLEPLAEYLLSFPIEGNVEEEAEKYVTKEVTEELEKQDKVVKDVKEAIQGAQDIVAEMVADEAKYRKFIRHHFEIKSVLETQVKDPALDEKKVFEMYYAYSEPVRQIKLHRVLAINRGEAEKILKVNIVEDMEYILNYLFNQVILNPKAITADIVKAAVEDGYKRLIRSSIEREIRAILKEKAEDQAISVFSENLKRYLLTPPIKGKMVLGVDPAYRTGCKLAVVDTLGKFMDKGVIYPHQKYPGEHVGEDRITKATERVVDLVKKYNIDIIAIGNGTASRETESFIASTVKQYQLSSSFVIVNEAGASVYSASDLARKEFPEFEVEERSAVSIARRVQDPLSELVKIDPKSIGVGQYQYDVAQAKLNDSLNFVVSSAVNSVGVDVNTASVSLLERVSGLNAGTAGKIVEHREKNGRFHSRNDLNIKGIGPKTFEQAIGFLRITEGEEKLDMTSIHPESYETAEVILKKLGFTKDHIGSKELQTAIHSLDREALRKELNIGEYTYNDILDALAAPLRDPRDAFDQPLLRSDVLKLEDLKPGMELQGVVRNVVDFGVFVDCGVKEDGLVHISRISTGYIKHPLDKVSVGDIVKVWVLAVHLQKGRLELTMVDPAVKK